MKNPDTRARLALLSEETLAEENRRFRHTGGVSANNRSRGFVPAFLDTATGKIYRSCFSDGRAAPVHLLAGLPRSLFESSGATPSAVKACVVAGFLRDDIFYSREEAAQAVATGRLH